MRPPARHRGGIHARLPQLFGDLDLCTFDERFKSPGPRVAAPKGSSVHTRERPDGYYTAPTVVKWESWSPGETAEHLRQIWNIAMGNENANSDATVDLGKLLTRMRQISNAVEEEENAALDAELDHGNLLLVRHEAATKGHAAAPPCPCVSEAALLVISSLPAHPPARR